MAEAKWHDLSPVGNGDEGLQVRLHAAPRSMELRDTNGSAWFIIGTEARDQLQALLNQVLCEPLGDGETCSNCQKPASHVVPSGSAVEHACCGCVDGAEGVRPPCQHSNRDERRTHD